MAEAGCTYGMPLQARVLQANTCERSKSQWLVGTTSLRNENEVRLRSGASDADAPPSPSTCPACSVSSLSPYAADERADEASHNHPTHTQPPPNQTIKTKKVRVLEYDAASEAGADCPWIRAAARVHSWRPPRTRAATRGWPV